MDTKTVRDQLKAWNARLAEVDQEREILIAMIRDHEAWLRLQGAADLPKVEAPSMPLPTKPKRSGAVKGTVSMRKAVMQVLREAQGEPLHAREIYARAQALGAITNGKEPTHVVDLMGYALRDRSEQPIERVAPMTWRWTG